MSSENTSKPKPILLDVEISASDSTSAEMDNLTRQLQSELKQKKVLVKSTKVAKGAGKVSAIGMLAVAVLPVVLPSFIGIIQSWMTRGHGRTVKFTGKGIEFEGSPEELQKLLAVLEKRRPRLAGDSSTDAPPPPKKD